MAHSDLDLALERGTDVPLGTQLAWKLRAAIAGGGLGPGDRMPPVRELAERAGVNVNTVRAVYARLAKQGVIVSEQGRGTFVGSARGRAGLGELVERAARDARRHAVDPRDLAAMLYARFDDPAAAPDAEAGETGIDARRALRLEIEALEHELAALEPLSGAADGDTLTGAGARLIGIEELEATRDELAERVAQSRRGLRAARARARSRAATAAEPRRERGVSPWPELLPPPSRLAT